MCVFQFQSNKRDNCWRSLRCFNSKRLLQQIASSQTSKKAEFNERRQVVKLSLPCETLVQTAFKQPIN